MVALKVVYCRSLSMNVYVPADLAGGFLFPGQLFLHWPRRWANFYP